MATIHQVGPPQTDSGDDRQVVFVKGAPDRCVLGADQSCGAADGVC
jgi:hypothetical protein